MFSKTKTSELWRFFTPIDEHFATCKMCKQKLSYLTTTSNLKKHLQKKHPTVLIPEATKTTTLCPQRAASEEVTCLPSSRDLEPSTSKHSSVSTFPSEPETSQPLKRNLTQKTCDTFFIKKITGRSKDKIDRQLLKLFFEDYQPFSIVEDKGFVAFVKALNPSYQIPSRTVLSKSLIPALYEECKSNSKTLLDLAKSVCITTDSWTSINTESFTAVTAHFLNNDFKLISLVLDCSIFNMRHTADNLADELKRVADEWDIRKKIILAISDNATNIVKAIKTVGWKHLSCMAHTINLIVKDGLKNDNLTTIINKVKEIVKYFRKSSTATEKLMKYQKNSGVNVPLKLVLEVPTRWNSTFFMVKRFVALEDAIKSTMAVLDKELPLISIEEWRILKQICEVLEPFEDITKTLSGEKYCSAAIIIPICNGLRKVLDSLLQRHYLLPVCQLVMDLRDSFEGRLGTIENSKTLAMCTFLDPKFKNMGFSNKNIAANTKQNIVNMIAAKITTKSIERYVEISEETRTGEKTEGPPKKISIWSEFDNFVASSQPKGTSSSRAIIEIQRYMEEDIIPRHCDSLLWWSEHKQLFPNLAEIATERLCVLASSVPCERLFSKAGQILTERRSRLSEKTVRKLLFLNTNMNCFDPD